MLSTTIAAPAKAGAIPARAMTAEVAVEAAVVAIRIATPPPPTSGGLRSYRIAPTLASRGGLLGVVHCHRIGGGGVGGVGGGGAHPSDDRKDDNISGGSGGTRHHRGDCDNVAGYRRRRISRGCDRDFDDDDDNAGHTTLSGQRDRGSAPLLLPLLPLLSVGGTVPLICAHP